MKRAFLKEFTPKIHFIHLRPSISPVEFINKLCDISNEYKLTKFPVLAANTLSYYDSNPTEPIS